MTNTDLINKFYTGFAEGDSNKMAECYHKEVVFNDPAFGTMKGERANNMWKMLMSKKTADFNFSYGNVESTPETGKATWTAEYQFGDKKRPVVNNVTAQFKFKDGLIIEHTDTFDLYKWSKQALGAPGFLLGWSNFMRKKIQKNANDNLDAYLSK